MSSFKTHSYFPYLCAKCGLVEVNVAADKIVCPECQSEEIDQYGLEKASDLKLKQKGVLPSLQNFNREAYQDGHKCPYCDTFNLSFSYAKSFSD